ncbi:MAG: Zn-dependent exopeptidase M28 [Thermoplasmatales archaeon]|nr:Zn-dependent exopeptidase M28 [Thermoplasmatales archaeon]
MEKALRRVTAGIAILLLFPSFCYNNYDKYGSYDNYDKNRIEEILSLLNEEMLFNYTQAIVSFGPRVTGSDACYNCAKYIHEKFLSFGLDSTIYNWSVSSGLRKYNGQNVEGVLPGDEKIIIFNAHFDSVENTVGADDNAAGVASLIAVAEVMSKFRFNHTVKFVAFSGEENGLLGSNEYARNSYEKDDFIIVEMNADMIAHANGENGSKFRIYATEDADWIVEKIKEINKNFLSFELIIGNINRKFGGSDYLSFAKYGFESIAFFEYEWNPYMHQPEDDLSNVNFSYLLKTTRLIAGAIACTADAEIEKPYFSIISPRRGGIYFNGEKVYELRNEKLFALGKIFLSLSLKNEAEKIKVYLDNKIIHVFNFPPYEMEISFPSFGKHELKLIAYNKNKFSTDWIEFYWLNLF